MRYKITRAEGDHIEDIAHGDNKNWLIRIARLMWAYDHETYQVTDTQDNSVVDFISSILITR
jgi:hypothetical protein